MASLATRLSELITVIKTETKALRTLISGTSTGNNSALTTTATNLVAAINEVKVTADAANSATGNTNLSITKSSTVNNILSDTGTDVTITLADGTNAGLFSPSEKTKLTGIETGATADQVASEVPLTASGNLVATNVQTALYELQGDVDTINSSLGGLTDAVVLKGTHAVSGNTFPGGGTAKAGWSYIITTPGTMGGVQFDTNDRVIALVANASTTTYAGNWHKLDYTDQVLSVAGRTGAITLATSDITGLDTALGLKANVTDVYTKTEIGNPDTDLVALWNAA